MCPEFCLGASHQRTFPWDLVFQQDHCLGFFISKVLDQMRRDSARVWLLPESQIELANQRNRCLNLEMDGLLASSCRKVLPPMNGSQH